MRVLLAGDTHGNVEHIAYVCRQAGLSGSEKMVVVGDFGYGWDMRFPSAVNQLAKENGLDAYWLDGNHENFDVLESRGYDLTGSEPQQMESNLSYLGRGCRFNWEGCDFVTLGGAFSIDKDTRVEGFSWWPQETITTEQVGMVMDGGPADIMLTHDTPEGTCPVVGQGGYKGDNISRGNRLAVTAAMEAVSPRLLVHGHMHHRYSVPYLLESGEYVQVQGLGRDGDWGNSWIVIDTDDWKG